jgi:hypothetical protein
MEHYTFKLCKVPTNAQAMEQGVAWISSDNRHLANSVVIINEREFTLKVSDHLTADKIALSSECRTSLNLLINDIITVNPVRSSEGK